MFFQRKIYPALKEHLSAREVTVVTGMRRTGKTTLLRKMLSEVSSENKLYLDCENIADRELFSEKNYNNIPLALKSRGFDTTKKLYIALDEIQLVPNIPSVIKYLHDHYDVKFLVTGSSSYYLKNLFSESLAGRKKIFELHPLDFGEFLTFKGVAYTAQDITTARFIAPEYERIRTQYTEFIRFGGFPEVVLAGSDVRKRELLTDILSSYINIDIATLSDFRRKDVVLSLMQMLATRAGGRLDYAKLARNIGISPVTVQSYVDFFEETYFLSRIPVFSRNPDRAIVKAKNCISPITVYSIYSEKCRAVCSLKTPCIRNFDTGALSRTMRSKMGGKSISYWTARLPSKQKKHRRRWISRQPACWQKKSAWRRRVSSVAMSRQHGPTICGVAIFCSAGRV